MAIERIRERVSGGSIYIRRLDDPQFFFNPTHCHTDRSGWVPGEGAQSFPNLEAAEDCIEHYRLSGCEIWRDGTRFVGRSGAGAGEFGGYADGW